MEAHVESVKLIAGVTKLCCEANLEAVLNEVSLRTPRMGRPIEKAIQRDMGWSGALKTLLSRNKSRKHERDHFLPLPYRYPAGWVAHQDHVIQK